MKTYRLDNPGLLDPTWFQRVRHGRHEAVVTDDGHIHLDGVALRFAHGECLPAGTPVQVWLDRNFVCGTVDDLQSAAQAHHRQREKARAAERQRRNQRRVQAEAFNATLTLPVAWDTGFKDVVSGLLEGSSGDGRNRASVTHILLLEQLQEGRLKRNAGDFLCTSASGSNGRGGYVADTRDRAVDGDGNEYAPEVTCKACLRLAQRWKETSP
jgi:hypothetical protein